MAKSLTGSDGRMGALLLLFPVWVAVALFGHPWFAAMAFLGTVLLFLLIFLHRGKSHLLRQAIRCLVRSRQLATITVVCVTLSVAGASITLTVHDSLDGYSEMRSGSVMGSIDLVLCANGSSRETFHLSESKVLLKDLRGMENVTSADPIVLGEGPVLGGNGTGIIPNAGFMGVFDDAVVALGGFTTIDGRAVYREPDTDEAYVNSAFLAQVGVHQGDMIFLLFGNTTYPFRVSEIVAASSLGGYGGDRPFLFINMAIDRALNLLHSKEVRRTLLAILFFAVVTFAVFWGYLLGGNAIVGSDGMGPPADLAMMQEDSSYFSSWRAMPALGHLNFPSPTLSALYIVDMEWLGLSPVSTTQVILVSSFWLAGFAMYICASRILGSSSAGLIAGLAYLFNQVFLSQVTEAHHYFLIGCAIFPLLFLVLYRAVNDLDRRSGVALPVVAYIFGTVAAPNLVMIASIFLILFFLTYILIARGWSWVRRGYSVMVAAVCLILVLLPTVLMKYLAGGTPVLATYYPIEQARLYSSYTIYHSFVLASSENTFIYSSNIGQWTFISSLWVVGLIVAIVIPLTALLSILVKEKRHMVISFVVPMAIFIVLATGTNLPFGGLFTYLFKNVPLMDSLRVYSRFHLMTGFAMKGMVFISSTTTS